MIVRSQNGYRANDQSLTAWYVVPGTRVGMRLRKGAVAEVLLWLAAQFDDLVEDLDTARTFDTDSRPDIPGGAPSSVPDDWSYAERDVRGSMEVSNHASGTAIDMNAIQHMLGREGTFTPQQVLAIRKILAKLIDPVTKKCVVRWGADYCGRKDPMHWEIVGSLAAVARVAERLKDNGRDDMPTARECAQAVWGADTVPIKDAPADNRTWTAENTLGWLVDNLRASREREEAMGRLLTDILRELAALQAAVKKPVL